MAKGSFTQCACLLLDRTPTLNEIEGALHGVVEVSNRHDESEDWQFFGPSLTIPFRQDVNGYVAVDVVDRPWPDDMGDPDDDPTLFGAWAMGYFGPGAFPQGLDRAQEQAWGWDDESDVFSAHKAFIRVRLSYVFGEQDEDAPVMPDDCDPLEELDFITVITTALMKMPGVLGCFNPNGEVLLNQQAYDETLRFHAENESIPFELWSNVRLFHVEPNWCLIDTVGNDQFDLPDIEAAYCEEVAEAEDVNEFIRNVTYYLLSGEHEIESGDSVEGPGDAPWTATVHEDSTCDPPRPVIRLVPEDDREMPEELIVPDETVDDLTGE